MQQRKLGGDGQAKKVWSKGMHREEGASLAS